MKWRDNPTFWAFISGLVFATIGYRGSNQVLFAITGMVIIAIIYQAVMYKPRSEESIWSLFATFSASLSILIAMFGGWLLRYI